MTETGLQAVVTTNIKVLMAVHRIEAQKDLAAMLGWGESKLTKSLRGDRKWSLEDLPELANVFGVQPAALVGDVGLLVNTAAPAMTGTDRVTRRVTSQYSTGNDAHVIPFPQVGKTRSGYRSIRPQGGRPGTRFRARSRRGSPFASAAV